MGRTASSARETSARATSTSMSLVVRMAPWIVTAMPPQIACGIPVARTAPETAWSSSTMFTDRAYRGDGSSSPSGAEPRSRSMTRSW
jgi:hypothetical protein